MKILMSSYEFPPLGGGGSRVVRGLATQLVRGGHEVDVVTMGYDDLPAREEVSGVRVHRVRCWRRDVHVCSAPEAATYLASAGPLVRSLASRGGYDLFHAHFILPDGLLAWATRRVAGLPYLITAHGSDVPGYNPDRLQRAHVLLAPLWRSIVKGAETIVCPSETLESLVEEQGAARELASIPNGIDADRFEAAAPRQQRILVVSRLLQRKGVQCLIDAVADRTEPIPVVVVGEGPYRGELERRAREAGAAVEFRGWLENDSPALKALYETSTVFVLPSEAENFPVVLLEAMAAGLSIVTTSGTGCAEVVGDAGLLVPPRDTRALRSALDRLIADASLRRSLGEAGRRRVEERFTWPAVARRYEELYARHLRTSQQVS